MAVKYSLDPNGTVRQYYQREEEESIIKAPSDENWKLGGLKVVPQKKHRRRTQNQVWKTTGFEETSNSGYSNRKHNKKNHKNGNGNQWDSSVKKSNHYINEGSAESFYGNTYCGMSAGEQMRMMRRAYDAGHSDACHHRYSPPGGLTEGQRILSIINGVIIAVVFIFFIFAFLSKM